MVKWCKATSLPHIMENATQYPSGQYGGSGSVLRSAEYMSENAATSNGELNII
jgi:hypothetical protein